jgi:hypothetical protein
MVLRARDEWKLDPTFPFDLVAAAPNGRRVGDAGRSVIYLGRTDRPLAQILVLMRWAVLMSSEVSDAPTEP